MDDKQVKVAFERIEVKDRPFEPLDAGSLLLLPTIDMTMFPGVATMIMPTRPESAQVIETALKTNEPVAVFCQLSRTDAFPNDLADIAGFGVAVQVMQLMPGPNGSPAAFVRAYPRLVLEPTALFKDVDGMVRISANERKDVVPRTKDETFVDLMNDLSTAARQILSGGDESVDLSPIFGGGFSNEELINVIATNAPIPVLDKIAILGERNIRHRASRLLGKLAVSDHLLKSAILKEVNEKAKAHLNEQQRRAVLQAHYDVVHKELYGDDDFDDDYSVLAQKADEANLPEAAAAIFEKELRKLKRFNPSSPDYAVLYTYLETLIGLPWNSKSDLNDDFSKAEDVLEADHYGMKEVKERILQNLALSITRRRKDSPVLCLVGAPGVGKTSVGRSIAKALGREYQRISLGGLHDESEIRGHRRTYIGAMPGRIISAIINAKVNNPVLLLDEIDKLGSDFKGDPNAALLEVLDPEQHSRFHDNYVDVDFDLSDVFFIATANTLDTVPRPLLDRMEIIEMPGYLPEEKLEIAKRHLIPNIREKHGLTEADFGLTDDAVMKVIKSYTAESGVRTLEKRIAELSRKLILEKLRASKRKKIASLLGPEDVTRLLGVEKYLSTDHDNVTPAGVVTGLAWTALGGEILEIECSLSAAKGEKLTLTGNLGDVMKESAMLASQYVRAHAAELGIEQSMLENHELHIHVPEAAVPKDGPSAGITLTTAIVSLLTRRPVKPGIAMTGEMTLRGKVLPVGGIKEKILAAKRSGITDIYMSRRNERDVKAIDAQLLEGLEFHFVDNYSELQQEIFE